MEVGTEKCVTLIMRSGKKQMPEGMELSDQERIRTLREKKTNKYLEILEMKEKKSISEEQENSLKPSFAAEISSKG